MKPIVPRTLAANVTCRRRPAPCRPYRWVGFWLSGVMLGACSGGGALSFGPSHWGVGALVENRCPLVVTAAAGLTRQQAIDRLTERPVDIQTGAIVEVAVVLSADSPLPRSLFVAVATPERTEPLITELEVDVDGSPIDISRLVVEPDCEKVGSVEQGAGD